jgi:predicted membrane-bound spermidine synthase
MATLWHKSTETDEYRVTRAGHAVRLYRNAVLHSQWNPSKPVSGLLWDLFLLSSLNSDITRVLVLGAGGGAVINLVHYFFPHAKIDAVELDKYHIHAARKFFKVNTKFCRVHQDDVTHWVKNSKQQKFDLIIDDVFFEGQGDPYRSVDAHAKWIGSLLKKLTQQGVLVINFADDKEWRESKKQLEKQQYFKGYNFASSRHGRCENRIIHISRQDISLSELRRGLQDRKFKVFEKNLVAKVYRYRTIRLKVA